MRTCVWSLALKVKDGHSIVSLQSLPWADKHRQIPGAFSQLSLIGKLQASESLCLKIKQNKTTTQQQQLKKQNRWTIYLRSNLLIGKPETTERLSQKAVWVACLMGDT